MQPRVSGQTYTKVQGYVILTVQRSVGTSTKGISYTVFPVFGVLGYNTAVEEPFSRVPPVWIEEKSVGTSTDGW